jgi:hypothetical protein
MRPSFPSFKLFLRKCESYEGHCRRGYGVPEGKLKLEFKLNGTHQLLVYADDIQLLGHENVRFSQAMGHETIISVLIL